MKFKLKKHLVWVAGLALALVGCGGGGGGGSTGTAGTGTVASTSVPVTITVMDGLIQGATVCLDRNNNGLCDTEDAPQKTNANGQATFLVPAADVGKFPALAWVGTDATDKDTGPVLTRYTLKAPKDAVSLVTPLTTLVQTLVEATGASTRDAAAAIQYQLGMRNSPLDDFTRNGDAKAQAVANAMVISTQKQGAMLASAVGKTTASRVVVTQMDIDMLVARKVLSLTDWLAYAVTDSDVASTTSAATRLAALSVKAQALLNTNGIPDGASALAALEHIKQSQPGNGFLSGMASAWLAYLSFDAPNDVYARYVSSSATENTPAANNILQRWLRFQAYPNGDVATWSVSGGPKWGSELHWNGKVWKVCGINDAHTATVPDANGNSSINNCDGVEQGTVQSRMVDISGQKMLAVYQSLQNQGYTNVRVGNSNADASAWLGTASFPGGSSMVLRKTINTSNAYAYYPGNSNRLELPEAALAAGTADACNAAVFTPYVGTVTLEKMVATLRGTPCRYQSWSSNEGLNGALLDTGAINDAWGNTTLSLGILGSAKTVENLNQATSFYTGNTPIRVAFGSGNQVTYYACQESWGGSVRNCTSAGTGTYTIETLGDARVLHFNGLPSLLHGAQNWERVYIERGNVVHFGYRDLPYPVTSAWLNLPATNALFAQLGLGRTVDPNATQALTASSYEGTYKGVFSGTSGSTGISGLFTFVVAPGQALSCSGTSSALVSTGNASGAFTCTNAILNPGTPGSTVASISFGMTSSGDSFSGTVNYYTGVVSGTWKSAGGASGTFTALRE